MGNIMVDLTQVARQAYGSRFFEATNGGRGNIGMLNGRVIKFNTHGDKGGDFAQMKASCDELRRNLLQNAQKAKLGDDALKDIRKMLGMNDSGVVTSKGLLERKTVAQIITKIEQNSELKVWDTMKRENGAVNSRGKDTAFKTVSAETVKMWGDLRPQVATTGPTTADRQLKLCDNVRAMLMHTMALPAAEGDPSLAQLLPAMDRMAYMAKNLPVSKEQVGEFFSEERVRGTVEDLRNAAQAHGEGEMRDSLFRLAEMMEYALGEDVAEGVMPAPEEIAPEPLRQMLEEVVEEHAEPANGQVGTGADNVVDAQYDWTGAEKMQIHAPTASKSGWDDDDDMDVKGGNPVANDVEIDDDDDGFEIEKNDNAPAPTKENLIRQHAAVDKAGQAAFDVAEKLASTFKDSEDGVYDMSKGNAQLLPRGIRTARALTQKVGEHLIAQGNLDEARKLFDRADRMFALILDASKNPDWTAEGKNIDTAVENLSNLLISFNTAYGHVMMRDMAAAFSKTPTGQKLLQEMPGRNGVAAFDAVLEGAIDQDALRLRLEDLDTRTVGAAEKLFKDDQIFYGGNQITALSDGEDLACKLMGVKSDDGKFPKNPAQRSFAIRFGAAYGAFMTHADCPPSLFNMRIPARVGGAQRMPVSNVNQLLVKAGCDIPSAYVSGSFALKMAELMRTAEFDGVDAQGVQKIVKDVIAETQFVTPEEFAILSAKTEGTSPVSFELPTVTCEGMQKLAADLMCPADIGKTVISSTGDAEQVGARMHGVLSEHKDAFVRIFKELRNVEAKGPLGKDLLLRADVEKCPSLAGLEDDERAIVAEMVVQMALQNPGLLASGDKIEDDFEATFGIGREPSRLLDEQQQALTKLEAAAGEIATGVCAEIQKTIASGIERLFPKTEAKPFDDSQDSLEKILASGEDQDLKFLKTALQQYFAKLGQNDARLLLATKIRNRDPAAEIPGLKELEGVGYKDGVLVDEEAAKKAEQKKKELLENANFSAVLKSSGPILLKMLQGLDTSNFGDDGATLKDILADVKDNLYPIPQEHVKAFLEDRIAHSDPKIANVTIRQSLGAASVGQTFLCDVVYEDGTKETCAIKVLRTESGLRAEREKKILGDVAGGMDDSMRATFLGKANRIMEEFDFSTESVNIQTGREVYGPEHTDYKNVDSVEGLGALKPTSHVLGMKAVKGTTYKRRLEKMDEEIKNATDPQQLGELRKKVVTNHRALENLAKLWISRAIFTAGKGVYHGDLHSGNIMVDDAGKATMIDFGNVTNLSEKEVKAFMHVIAGAAAGVSDGKCVGVLSGFYDLLSPEAKEKFDARLAEDARRKKADPAFRTLQDRISHILSLGNGQDVGLRVSCILKLMRTEGFEVPPAIYNFNESQVRLGEVLASSKKTLEALDGKLAQRGGEPVAPGEEPEQPAEAPLKSLIDCVGEVVQNNVEFTIGQVGKFNGLRFAAGFCQNGLITSEQYEQILNDGIAPVADAVKNKLDEWKNKFASFFS